MESYGFGVKLNKARILYYLFQFFSVSNAVPHPYCLHPLNRSDCRAKPTPVFSYYKPGSRCEIETWRGCPTWNKFEDEYSCSHLCIMRLGAGDYGDMQSNIIPTEAEPSEESTCVGILDTSDCGKTPVKVFTYDESSKSCVKKTWHGCRSTNKFYDEISCIDLCVQLPETVAEWEEKMENLEEPEIEEINQIIDDLLPASSVAPLHLMVTETTPAEEIVTPKPADEDALPPLYL